MNIAYIEMIGGASGNMLLGAFIDAGAPKDEIEAALRTLPAGEWSLVHERVTKRDVAATYVDFDIPGDAFDGAMGEHEHGRHLADVLDILAASGLSERQKARASAIYRRFAQAEASAHGAGLDDIHFHECGAIDAILDVAATCVALDLLGIDEVICSPFPTGRGTIRSRHGIYPNPPPATWELLRGFPTFDAGIDGEMVTPTGAAILTTLAKPGAERPPMRVERIGYGAGSADFAIPNVTRVSIGSPVHERASNGAVAPNDDRESVAVLEANIDDMAPQYFELAIERLFAAGALDVWLTPIVMKKSRPALMCSAIAPPDREEACARVLLAETTTLGVRVRRERRYVAERSVEPVSTALGIVRVKSSHVDGTVRRTLEYDDVVRIARERGRPIAEVVRQLEAALPPL